MVTRLGYRLTRRQSGMPDQPEVVVAGLRKLIFVYSCVAHGHIHPGCDLSAPPAVPSEAWIAWRTLTRDRDRRRFARLRARGWSVLVLWECQLTRAALFRRHVRQFLQRTEPDR